MHNNNNLKALIFDIDGTFALTEEAHRASFNELFAQWDLGWHWDEALYKELLLVGGSRERIKYYAKMYQPDGADIVIGHDETVVKMHQQKTQIYTEKVSSGQVQLRAGVERLVEESLSQGIQLGIATTTNITPVRALFEGTLGLDALAKFTAVAAGDMARHKKPAPDLFQLALSQLGLQAKDCIAIEDSRIGLLAATSASIPTVITVNDYTVGQDFSEALIVLESLNDASGKGGLLYANQSAQSLHTIVDLERVREWHRQAA